MLHPTWKTLNAIEDLDLIDQLSNDRLVVIFKHSTRCGISVGAEFRLKEGWTYSKEEAVLFHLDILNHRDLSNAISDKYQVVHQSPQVIIIKDGRLVDTTSHHMINSGFVDRRLVQESIS